MKEMLSDKAWKKEQRRRDHIKDRWSELDRQDRLAKMNRQAQKKLHPERITKVRMDFDPNYSEGENPFNRRSITTDIADQLWEESGRLAKTFDKVRQTDEALYKDDPRNGVPDPYRAERIARRTYAVNRKLARYRPPPLQIESIPSDVQLIRPIPSDRRGRELIVDEIIQTEISAGRATEPFIEYFIQLYQYEEGLYVAGLTVNVPNPYIIVEQARRRWWKRKK